MKRQFAMMLALSSSFALLPGCAHTGGGAGGGGSAAPVSGSAQATPKAADDGDDPGTSATVIPGPAVIVPPPADVVPPNDGSGADLVNRVTVPRTTQARTVKVGAGERTDAGPPSPAGVDTNEGQPGQTQDNATPPASGAPPAGGGSNATQPDNGPGAAGSGDTGTTGAGTPSESPPPRTPAPSIAPDSSNIGQQQAPSSPSDDTQSRAGGAGPSGGTGSQDRFRRLDLNGNGVLSPQEAQGDPQLSTNFAATDANHDGVISASEFSQFENRARGH